MWIIDKFGARVWVANTRMARLMSKVFMKTEGDQEGGGGGGDELTEQQKIDKAVETATIALKANNATLISEKRALSAAAAIIESLGGQDGINALKDFKSKVENDEILKLAAEGKHGEAIERATERLKVDFNAERTTFQEKINTQDSELASAKEQLRTLIVDNSVVREFVGIKGLDTALPDVISRARGVFSVENGEPVARDSDGNLVQGAKGVLTVKEWAESLRKTAPHFFPGSQGSNLENGSNDAESLGALLVEASKKGASALRAEKERQKQLKEKASQK